MKSIIFNAEEVRATLEGRKKSFRAVIKPQPEFRNNHFYSQNDTTGFSKELFILDKCPYKIGDEIFVKMPASRMKQEQSRLTLRIKNIKVEKENNLWVWVVEFETINNLK